MRGRESNKIPWLRGSCGILVLTESSSSLHSAVCFGRLSEVEICSSIPPTALSQQQTTLKRTARQPLRHFRERRVFTDTLLARIWLDSKPITHGEKSRLWEDKCEISFSFRMRKFHLYQDRSYIWQPSSWSETRLRSSSWADAVLRVQGFDTNYGNVYRHTNDKLFMSNTSNW